MEDFGKILSSFYIKDDLNPIIWLNPDDVEKSKINNQIRDKLIEISDNFIEFLGYDIFIQDIVMTGSLANFNWSDYSDIDLHIMYDFNEAGLEKDLYQDIFKVKKTLFNSTHDITIKGYEVELYVQDINEPHISTGLYSVLYDEWIVEPSKEKVKLDYSLIKMKVDYWQNKILDLIDDAQSDDENLEDSIEKIGKLKDKIKKYRQSGLEREGEFSYENLVFKFLRRNGFIQKLFDFENKLLDSRLSLNE